MQVVYPVIDSIKGSLNLKKKPGEKKCDLTIQVEEDSIKVHRSKLRKSTSYFDEKYPPSFDDYTNTCVVTEVPFETVKIAVDFFYRKPISLSLDNLGDLLKLARKWRVQGLLDKCEQFMLRRIDPTFCMSVKRMAQRIGDEEIEKTVNSYVMTRLDEVVEGNAVDQLTEDELMMIISQYVGPIDDVGVPDLKKRDKVLWSLLKNWINFRRQEREDLFCKLFREMPLCFFDAVLVDKEILQEPLVANCLHCSSYVTESLLKVLEHRVEFNESTADFGLDRQFCSPEESFFLLAFAQKHDKTEIVKYVKKSMLRNFDEMIIHSEFVNIPKDDLVQQIEGLDRNTESEVQKWNAIVTWVKCESDREEDFPELFRLIRLDDLPLDFLKDTVIPEELTHNYRECIDAVMKVLLRRAKGS